VCDHFCSLHRAFCCSSCWLDPPSLAYAMLTLGGVGFACLGLDRLVLRMQRLAAASEAAHQKAQWNAGLIRSGVAAPITERDFPPLAHSGSWVAYAPQAHASQDITVNMVRPAMGDAKELARLEAKDEKIQSVGCCSRGTLIEFPYWPWYGRVFFFPILTFGRVPLFFYVIHWYVLGLGALFFHGVSDGLYMAYVPIWWVFLLVLMFFICAPYAKFKDRQGQESLWRFL
jgi:hypothetical protein